MNILDKLKINHRPSAGALDLLKYIGPGLLVTVGFIDPGNWATNLAAGSEFGYALLWVVTFSSIMLIIIQHNVAHLGIVTGLCLSEATNKYMPRVLSRPILISAMLAKGYEVSDDGLTYTIKLPAFRPRLPRCWEVPLLCGCYSECQSKLAQSS